MKYHRLSSFHYFPLLVLAAVLAGLGLFVWMVFTVWHPMPPRELVMITGGEGGDYFEYGKHYRDFLKKKGIGVRLLDSAGALENLRRLRDPRSGVSAGFIPAGVTNEQESPELVSLGTLSYEPLWFFYQNRGLPPELMFKGLKNKSISIGLEGSAGRALTLKIMALYGIESLAARTVELLPGEAGDQLIQGKIEAAVMTGSWKSPTVRRLLASKHIRLLNFPRADTYVALYPYLNKVTVPAGLGSLPQNLPPENVTLLAPKTSLVVRRELHSALQYLLLDAALEIHGPPGVFHLAGQFPAAEAFDLPLSENAVHFYKSGRPFLQRYLPFWLAVFVEQMLVILLPLLGILYPLLRFLPGLYGWGMRRKIYRLYGELKFLEDELDQHLPERDTGELALRLDALEERVDHVRLTKAYTHMLYTLKHHINLVRERLEKRPSGQKGSADLPDQPGSTPRR